MESWDRLLESIVWRSDPKFKHCLGGIVGFLDGVLLFSNVNHSAEFRAQLDLFSLQIVEFIAVLLKSGNEAAGKELASSGTIKRILELFFE